jgi:hypothetical protein
MGRIWRVGPRVRSDARNGMERGATTDISFEHDLHEPKIPRSPSSPSRARTRHRWFPLEPSSMIRNNRSKLVSAAAMTTIGPAGSSRTSTRVRRLSRMDLLYFALRSDPHVSCERLGSLGAGNSAKPGPGPDWRLALEISLLPVAVTDRGVRPSMSTVSAVRPGKPGGSATECDHGDGNVRRRM